MILLVGFNFFGLNMVESTKISSMALKAINKMENKSSSMESDYFTAANHLALIRFTRRVFKNRQITSMVEHDGTNKSGCKTQDCRSLLNQISVTFEKAKNFTKYLTYKECQDDPASQACQDKDYVIQREKMVYLIVSEMEAEKGQTSTFVFGTSPNIDSNPVTDYSKMDIMFKICIPVDLTKMAYLSTSCPYDTCSGEEYDFEFKPKRCLDTKKIEVEMK
jgi:hypothetical protein